MSLERQQPLAEQDTGQALSYLHGLGISETDIVGKKTLDIGAGAADFARWANKRGGDVVSIDLYPEWERLREIPDAQAPYVAGDATALPFPDSAFDLVISNDAIPNSVSVKPGETVELALVAKEAHRRRMAAVREAVRVLKPGGEVRFAPVVRNERARIPQVDNRNESMEKMLAELKSDPSLEVSGELLEKDGTNGEDIFQDSYRIIIKKKSASF